MTLTRSLFRCLLPVLLAMVPACSPDGALPAETNVVIVVIDTLRNDRLGVNGYGLPVSPCMDRLAREGIIFRGALAPSSWTKPSVASIFTGLYPGRHGAIGDLTLYTNLSFLDEKLTTLAERLKEDGYRTAAFIYNANIIPFYHFDQGFDDFTQPAYEADKLLTQAARWVEEKGGKDPFFLYLHLIDPHSPYFPPETYRERFAPEDPGPKTPFTRLGRYNEVTLWLQQYLEWEKKKKPGSFTFDFSPEILQKWLKEHTADLTLEKVRERIHLDFNGRDDPELLRRIRHLLSLYDGEVSFADDALNRFVNDLEGMGILDSTVLIVTSDHGEGFLEHDSWGHRRTVFGEEIDVPLIFRVPGRDGTPLKGDFAERVSLVDLYPTVMDMLGLPIPNGLDGLSLWPAMQGREGARLPGRPIFTESFLDTGDHVSVVAEGKKVIRVARGKGKVEWLFYDLEKDPGEQSPMDPREAGKAGKALMKAVEQFLKERTLDFNKEGRDGTPSAEEIAQLRELGYI